ncbi:hypothetical protein EDE08_103661 [Bradyrhizobium sp. R2.2-H]|jgi:hypothetical protein|uniref:hypothetical protein n=1 Tax=unclassified Bradyrhizobium TaxID=2631580 RepID=UPI0010453B04|nr:MULTISPECIES: hypothetical protein [unclassified Bradyrhizobium]TCU75438.1 hypothetical protein EDE10_103660 [Bradyrhizobium sp. Y-H1]TCU78206.1 hypothetical protein EDE08_103661 [Bradyrhizobium sp. R2.2-H]
MGEAKRRKMREAELGPVVYHHTSTLRTNLLWMSGVIEVEGQSRWPAFHPKLGEIRTDALMRRAMKDFPPVAWFTSEIDIPNCLRNTRVFLTDNKTGEIRYEEEETGRQLSDVLALNRVAIGFRLSENSSIVPWRDHPGYLTSEGAELNETARDVGDDPDKWYVSEQPIDLLKSVQIWSSRSVTNPKLERWDWYLKDVHNMVRGCRTNNGMYIPPTWLKDEEARALARAMGMPAISGAADISTLPK